MRTNEGVKFKKNSPLKKAPGKNLMEKIFYFLLMSDIFYLYLIVAFINNLKEGLPPGAAPGGPRPRATIPTNGSRRTAGQNLKN